MLSEDISALYDVARWIGGGNRKVRKTIRALAKTETNYQLIIREIDRVEAQCKRAQLMGAPASLTLVEWLVTLDLFEWRCAYCQCEPFQIMSHVIPLPPGGTTPENCVPACHKCNWNGARKDEQVRTRIQAHLVDRVLAVSLFERNRKNAASASETETSDR